VSPTPKVSFGSISGAPFLKMSQFYNRGIMIATISDLARFFMILVKSRHKLVITHVVSYNIIQPLFDILVFKLILFIHLKDLGMLVWQHILERIKVSVIFFF